MNACALRFKPIFEELERRDVPAGTILNVGQNLTFIDGHSNLVTLRVAGSTGKAEFQDPGLGPITNGDNIAHVIITGASANFQITYSVNGSASTGDVILGNITTTNTIQGIYTVQDNTTPVTFQLLSFVGPGLSPGGSINVDTVTGNPAGLGISLGTLANGAAVDIRNFITADLVITGTLAGDITVGTGGASAASDWNIAGGVVATGSIVDGGSFFGTMLVGNTFAGATTIAGGAFGLWQLKGDTTGTLQASGWSNVREFKNFSGQLNATNTNITLDVKGSVLGTALINSSGNLTLTVAGSIASGAQLGVDGTLSTSVIGSVSGLLAGGVVTLTVGGALSNASISSVGDIIASLKAVTNSKITSGHDISATVTGALSGSTFFATNKLSLSVTGSVTGSNLECGSADMSLNVTGSLTGTHVSVGSQNITASVTGSVTGCSFISSESGAFLTIGGDLVSSVVEADTVSVNVTGNLTSSRIVGDEAATETVTVGKSVSLSRIVCLSANLSISVGASLMTSTVLAGKNLTLTVGSLSLAGSVTGVTATATDGLISAHVFGTVTGSTITSGHNTQASTLDISGSLLQSHVAAERATLVLKARDVTSDFVSGNSVSATISGSVKGSTLTATNALSLAITGSVSFANLEGSNADLTVTVGGSMGDTHVSCGSQNVHVNVTGSVTNSTFASSESSVSLSVGGDVLNSIVEGSGISINISGNLTGSRLYADETTTTIHVGKSVTSCHIAGDDITVTLSIGGSLTGSTVIAQNDISATVAGTVTSSTLTAAKSEVSLAVTGAMTKSQVSSGSSVTLSVGGGLSLSAIQGKNNVSLGVTGSLATTRVQSSNSDVSLTVTGAMSGQAVAAGTVNVSVGSLSGSLSGGALRLDVNGDVAATARMQATNVNFMDVDGFFAGQLNAVNLNTSGTLIKGSVSTTGKLSFSGTFGTAAVAFGTGASSFLGQLLLGSSLDQQLTFAGSVSRVLISGQVRNNIIVGGKLTYLSTGSLFTPTGNNGTFKDGRGNVTGNLTTVGGFTTVVPLF